MHGIGATSRAEERDEVSPTRVRHAWSVWTFWLQKRNLGFLLLWKTSDQVQKIDFFFLQTRALVLVVQCPHFVFSGISWIHQICEPAQASLPFPGQRLLIGCGDLKIMLAGTPL